MSRLQLFQTLFKRRFHMRFEREALREVSVGLGLPAQPRPKHPAMRMPFTPPRVVRSRRLRAGRLRLDSRQRCDQKSSRNETYLLGLKQTMIAKHYSPPSPASDRWPEIPAPRFAIR